MENREKITELIEKLLNLSKSSNENEASLALSKAQELLEKYNLTLADLQDRADTSPYLNMINIPVPLGNSQWKLTLTYRIAKLNFCSVVLEGTNCHVLGREENVYSVLAMASWLIAQLDSIAYLETFTYSGPVQKLRWRNSFLVGAVNRVVDRLKDERSKRLNQNQNLQALVISLGTELQVYIQKEYPRLSHKARTQTSLNRDGYNAGQAAGNRVSLYGSNSQLETGRLQLNGGS